MAMVGGAQRRRMDRNDTATSIHARPEDRASRRSAKRWVIGSGTIDCDHPEGALVRLGGDGLNGYYRCGRCEAGIVVQDEVAELV